MSYSHSLHRVERRSLLTRRARRLLPAAIVAVVLSAFGSALLAGNLVPATNAGVQTIVPNIPTALQLEPAETSFDSSVYSAALGAKLEGGGGEVAGQRIEFAIGTRNCKAITASNGTASCTIDDLATQPSGFRVVFKGDGALRGSSADGTLND